MSGHILKEKAEYFAKEFSKDFRASNGWLEKFKKRNNIIFKAICGEIASVNQSSTCIEWSAIFKDVLREYDPNDIHNADETALFYRCTPKKQ